MLYSSVILSCITSLLSPSLASPLAPRGLPGAVYTCTGPSFTGDCIWTAPTSTCRSLNPLSGPFSIGPDEGGSCTLYKRMGCGLIEQGDLLVFFPGKTVDLGDGFWSMDCKKDLVVPVGGT